MEEEEVRLTVVLRTSATVMEAQAVIIIHSIDVIQLTVMEEMAVL
jgi:hypothetical protein